ncbi:MAG: hypothetical protein Q7S72_01055 [Candidatus Taylorbacteria bacterium]|nr:hypothetical protein [Candidatus Taylorbacteria bacterium]
MTNETTPKYILDLKSDIISHLDKGFEIVHKRITGEINELGLMIYKTVVLKEDLKDLATKDDIKEIWDNMATKDDIKLIWDNMATKEDIKNLATKADTDKILTLIGSYEVRSKNIEEILLEDHKPRIVDLEKVVYSG